jgi:acetyl-CoA carboxylase biotin carboxylase subunit
MMRLRRALGELIVDGVETTQGLFFQLLENPEIRRGEYDIHWLESWIGDHYGQF